MAGSTIGFGKAAAATPDNLVDLTVDQLEGKTPSGVAYNYTLKVTNLGAKADSYRLQLGGPGYGLETVNAKIILPSGSSDNQLALDPGETGKAILTVTINATEGSFEVAVAARSSTEAAVWDAVSTTTTVVPESGREYNVEMEVQPSEQAVGKQVPAYYRLKVTNTGTVADTYKLSIANELDPRVKAQLILPWQVTAAWEGNHRAIGDSTHIFLNAGQTGQVILRVVVDAHAGKFVVEVKAQSAGDSEVSATVSTKTQVKVLPNYDIELWTPEPEKTTASGIPVDYWMVLANTGNVADAVKLSVRGDIVAGVEARIYLLRELDPATGAVRDEQSDRLIDGDWNLTGTPANKAEDLEAHEAQALMEIPTTKWVFLRPGEKVQLILRVTIDLQENQDYTLIVEADSRGGASATQKTVTTVKIAPGYGIDLSTFDNTHQTGRNKPTDYLVMVKNTGDIDDRYLIYLTGRNYGQEGVQASLRVIWPSDPGQLSSTDPLRPPVAGPEGQYYSTTATETVSELLWRDALVISLRPGQTAFLLLEVVIDKPAGIFEVAVAGHSFSDHDAKDKAATFTTIFIPRYGIDLAVADPEHTIGPGQTTRYLVSLTNTGNVRDTVALWLGGPDYRDPAVTARLWLLYLTADENNATSSYADVLFEANNSLLDSRKVPNSAIRPENAGWPDLRVTLNPGQTVRLLLAVKVTAESGSYGVNVYGLSLGGFVLKPELADNTQTEAEQSGRGSASSALPSQAPVNVGGGANVNTVPTKLVAQNEDAGVVAGDLTLLQTFDWIKTLTHIAEKPRHGVDVTIEDDQHRILSGTTTTYHLQVTNTGNLPDRIKLELGGRDYQREGVTARLFLYQLTSAATVDADGQKATNGDETTIVDGAGNYLASHAGSGYFSFDPASQFVRLDAGETVRFVIRVTVDLGPGDYEISVTGSSVSNPARWDAEVTTTTVIQDPIYGVDLKGEQTRQTLERGSAAYYFMVVANTGNVGDKVSLGIGGEAWGQEGVKAWLSVPRTNSADQQETPLFDTDERPLATAYGQFVPLPDDGRLVIPLNAGQRLKLMLTVAIEAPADDYQLIVTATSGGDPTQTASIEMVTTVIEQPRYGVDLTAHVTEQTVQTGEPARYLLTLTNTGNVKDTLKVALGGSAWGQEGVKARLSLIRLTEAVEGRLIDGTKVVAWANDTYFEAAEGSFETELKQTRGDQGFYLFLAPDQSVRLLLSVTVGSEPGKYEISVTATSIGDDTRSDSVVTMTKVRADPEYRIDLAVRDPTHYTAPGHPTYYLVKVTNLGNVQDTVLFRLGGTHYGTAGVAAHIFIPSWNQEVEELELEGQTGVLEVIDPTALAGEHDGRGTNLSRFIGPLPADNSRGLRLGPGQSAFIVLRVVIGRDAELAPEGYEIDLEGTSKGDPQRNDVVSTWTRLYRSGLAEGLSAGSVAGAFYLHKGQGEVDLYDENLTLEPLLVEPFKVKLRISGEFDAGRIVVVHLDRENGLATIAEPLLKLDGSTLIEKSLEEVLVNPTAGGFAVLEEANSTQLVVAIPHFSTHELEVSAGLSPISETEGENWWENSMAQIMVGLPWLMVMGVFGAMILARKPRGKVPTPLTLDETSSVEPPASRSNGNDQWAPLFTFDRQDQWRPPKP